MLDVEDSADAFTIMAEPCTHFADVEVRAIVDAAGGRRAAGIHPGG